MSKIEIRSDFIRIARAFTAGATGVFTTKHYVNNELTIERGIYVEPHPCGQGVQIVSTDNAALCVQWDKKGRVDRPRIITGITHGMALEMSGAVLDDRWLVGDEAKLSLRNDSGGRLRTKTLEGVAAYPCRIHGERNHEPGVSQFPAWRHLVPSQAEIDAMQDGCPGRINLAYMLIMGRLYADGTQNCREARIKYTAKGELPPVIMQFPWRKNMFVVIAPVKPQPDPSCWHDDFLHALTGEEPELRHENEDDDDEL